MELFTNINLGIYNSEGAGIPKTPFISKDTQDYINLNVATFLSPKYDIDTEVSGQIKGNLNNTSLKHKAKIINQNIFHSKLYLLL